MRWAGFGPVPGRRWRCAVVHATRRARAGGSKLAVQKNEGVAERGDEGSSAGRGGDDERSDWRRLGEGKRVPTRSPERGQGGDDAASRGEAVREMLLVMPEEVDVGENVSKPFRDNDPSERPQPRAPSAKLSAARPLLEAGWWMDPFGSAFVASLDEKVP